MTWIPKHPDQLKSLEEFIASLRAEEQRRDEAQRVIKDFFWKEKFALLFGKDFPSPEPLFAPGEDEAVFQDLNRYFDINLGALNAEDIRSECVQAAIKAHSTVIAVLSRQGMLTEELKNLLALITGKATQNALIQETFQIMEAVLERSIHPRVKDSLADICTIRPEAHKAVHQIACFCRSVKNGVEGAKNERDALIYPTILNYFDSNQRVEELFRQLKIKSEKPPAKAFWLF